MPARAWRVATFGRWLPRGAGLFFAGVALLQAWPGRGFWRGSVRGHPGTLTGMIQSTTGILPGDSGGPLIDTTGQVVGVDTAGEFSSRNPDAPAQASFAIPISTASASAWPRSRRCSMITLPAASTQPRT